MVSQSEVNFVHLDQITEKTKPIKSKEANSIALKSSARSTIKSASASKRSVEDVMAKYNISEQ